MPCLSDLHGIYSPPHVAICGISPEQYTLQGWMLRRFSFQARKTRESHTRNPVRNKSSVLSLIPQHSLSRQPVDFSTQTPGKGVEPTLHPLHRLLYTLLHALLYREAAYVSVVTW